MKICRFGINTKSNQLDRLPDEIQTNIVDSLRPKDAIRLLSSSQSDRNTIKENHQYWARQLGAERAFPRLSPYEQYQTIQNQITDRNRLIYRRIRLRSKVQAYITPIAITADFAIAFRSILRSCGRFTINVVRETSKRAMCGASDDLTHYGDLFLVSVAAAADDYQENSEEFVKYFQSLTDRLTDRFTR